MHAADISFVNLNSMFLTYGMSVRHIISKMVCTLCFRTRKRGKHTIDNLQIIFN